MSKYTAVTVAFVRECFDYDSETGLLTWRERPVEHFPCARIARSTNKRMTGKAAGNLGVHGYLQVEVKGFNFPVHRIAMALATGDWPPHQVDHINGIRTDNRLANLREVSHAENTKNRCMLSSNTSGATGVQRLGGKWRVFIGSGDKNYHVGVFDDFQEAVKARAKASEQFGFHKNHGRAA